MSKPSTKALPPPSRTRRLIAWINFARDGVSGLVLALALLGAAFVVYVPVDLVHTRQTNRLVDDGEGECDAQ